MNQPPCLTILPSLSATRCADGAIAITEKLASGITAYQQFWADAGGGAVRVLMEPGEPRPSGNLDERMVKPGELPWEIELVAYEKPALQRWLASSAVALLGIHYRQTPIAAWCNEWGVPAVYTAEYSLRTKLQIAQVERANPLVRLRRKMWLRGEERRVRQAITAAAGVQCNGTPTYDAYRGIARNALLYFDTRVSKSMLAGKEAIEKRADTRRTTGRLRLAFSGRLIAMKGADHVVRVAAELARRGVNFELAICGAGTLEKEMRAEVAAHKLEDRILFKGVLDFARELIPFVRDNVDVFVCCHRQGDPSCTYLETMSCGVPIAGYDNEAFVGVVKASGAGWLSPMNDPKGLAARIAALSADEIHEHSLKALAFAEQHTFEKTFRARIDHLWRLANQAPREPAQKASLA